MIAAAAVAAVVVAGVPEKNVRKSLAPAVLPAEAVALGCEVVGVPSAAVTAAVGAAAGCLGAVTSGAAGGTGSEAAAAAAPVGGTAILGAAEDNKPG